MHISLPEVKGHDSLALRFSEKYKYKCDLISYVFESNMLLQSLNLRSLYSVCSETDLCGLLLHFNQPVDKEIPSQNAYKFRLSLSYNPLQELFFLYHDTDILVLLFMCVFP